MKRKTKVGLHLFTENTTTTFFNLHRQNSCKA